MELREIQADTIRQMRETIRAEVAASTGFAPDVIDGINWEHPQFSIKKLREATSETMMPQLLRAGVSNYMYDAYQRVPTIYQDLVANTNSTKFEELYAPLYNSELPVEVQRQEDFPDSRIIGIDVHVQNRKFGRTLAIERELVDDDQTGQIAGRAGNLGEMMAYREELTVLYELINARDPLVNTSTLGSAYTTTIGNTPASPGQLSQPNLETADIALQNMVDPLGNFMLVMPSVLLVSPSDDFNARKLLQSTLQPSVPGSSGQTANTATSGLTGFTMTMNPLQGKYDLKTSRFLPGATSTQGGPGLTGPGLDSAHGAWFLLEPKRSFVFQDRDALEIQQEAPTSGPGFIRDVYRWRVRRRFAVRVLDGRFIYRGN